MLVTPNRLSWIVIFFLSTLLPTKGSRSIKKSKTYSFEVSKIDMTYCVTFPSGPLLLEKGKKYGETSKGKGAKQRWSPSVFKTPLVQTNGFSAKNIGFL